MLQRKLLVWASCSIAAIVSSLALSAATLAVGPTPVSVTVPDTTLTVRGFAAPNALVTIRENGTIIGTVTADANGYYVTTLTSQDTGVRTRELVYSDTNLLQSRISSQSISVQPQQNTLLESFLSPTVIRRTNQQVLTGSIVQFGGQTALNSTVELTLSNGDTYTAMADASGMYEFLIDTAGMNAGQYTATVQSTLGGDTSDVSRSVSFTLVEPQQSVPDPSNPVVNPPIVVIEPPDVLPPPDPVSPNDGSIIDDDSVVVSGTSVPNAQINIFENGQLIGSVFADQDGNWQLEYTASSSPVTLSFEACIEGRCSVLSTSITIVFTVIDSTAVDAGECTVDFHLQRYRFWGIDTADIVQLQLSDTTSTDFAGVFEIDWGDGTTQLFDYDPDQPEQWRHIYKSLGNYNGTITLYLGHNASTETDCKLTRYFSVHVTQYGGNQNIRNVLWLLLALLVLARYVDRRAEK